MDQTRDVVITQPDEEHERRRRDGERAAAPSVGVRDADLEPHEGLRYIARLFKILAVLLIVMLLFEIFIGLTQQGVQAIPTLIVEMTRLIVFAAFLWGAGDLALMLIESNHDLRATRILMGRLNGKVQRMVDLEADELELLAANPGMMVQRRADSRAAERDRKRSGRTAGDTPPSDEV